MDTENLMHKLLFGGLAQKEFEAKFVADVGELADETCVRVLCVDLPKRGLSEIYVLRGGLCVVADAAGNWHLFKTLARVEEEKYLSDWADFVRGTWVRKIPQLDGTYPTRDLEGYRAKDRILKRVNGRLLDVTCCAGLAPYGQVSHWRGDWWDRPYPRLKGAM